MTKQQEYYGKSTRWTVKQIFYGSHSMDNSITVCMCNSLWDASIIIDALVEAKKGRPFIFIAVKVDVDDYIDTCDAIKDVDLLTGDEIDLSKYLQGINCI